MGKEIYSCHYYHFECLHTGCNIVAVDKSKCSNCETAIYAPKRDENMNLIPELCIECKYPSGDIRESAFFEQIAKEGKTKHFK